MLNCTDLACILHHHHYYAQLHHLKHGTHHVEDGDAMSTETDDVNNDPLLLNDTDSEISDLSHLDGPNESVYMICGVLIAMILVGIIIVLLATIISKLRKREEHSNSVHPAEVVLQTAGTPVAPAPVATQQTPMQQPQPLPPDPIAYSGQFFWQYPPPPPQLHTLYSNDQETLVQNLPAERPGFCRGFRKNLGGRWRRLVKRKPTTDVYTIPAELKPQLKEIYVY